MNSLEYVTPAKNFLMRLVDDGTFECHSDLVAKGLAEGRFYRLVAHGGHTFLKKPRHGRARADALRPLIDNLPVCQKSKDDLYLEALRQDGAARLLLTKVVLRVRGRLRRPLSYGRVLTKET